MKSIAVGLIILALGFAACGFVTGELLKSAAPLIFQIPLLPFILYCLAVITLGLAGFAIYKAATYKGY
jgi:hypothetical protein